ncbi:ROK family protein [Sphingomonas lenta]|uniref:ROK family protein n=1 Tax=Sphingomonas lenta TaxID=1141887 RepID=UPI00159637A0|nr:ROK family protein [Sphingomonas lenta]
MASDIGSWPLVAGVELGGTKSIAVLVRGPVIEERFEIPTIGPDETLPVLADWLLAQQARGARPVALGIGSFGPLGLDRGAANYATLGATPKFGWAGTDVLAPFARLGVVATALDTDVNAAALAEATWGAARNARVSAYLTIGTGVGVGIVSRSDDGLHRIASELGHARVRRNDDAFPGVCPFHGDCVEGLASGPAISMRTGRAAGSFDPADPVWDDVAREIGELLSIITLAVSPDVIVVGGGVGLSSSFPRRAVVEAAERRLGGYLPGGRSVSDLVTWASFGADTGPIGAAALAYTALPSSPEPRGIMQAQVAAA